jgi:cell wall-associated NlpC family hydrolase
MALGKADIKIADYVKYSEDSLESLVKIARKIFGLNAKRKAIRKERLKEEEERQRRAEEQRLEKEAEEKERLEEEERQRRAEAERLAAAAGVDPAFTGSDPEDNEANLAVAGDNPEGAGTNPAFTEDTTADPKPTPEVSGATTTDTDAKTTESAAQAVVTNPRDTFCDIVRGLVETPYEYGVKDPNDGGLDCSGLVVYALRQMGYDISPDTDVAMMVSETLDWLTIISPGDDDSQAEPGRLNFYKFQFPDFQHVNVGVGQRDGEPTGQIVDATSGATMLGRNDDAYKPNQTTVVGAGQVNQTFPPYSTNSYPELQGIIKFDILEENHRKKPEE